jgi:hypothetical protein
MLYYNMEVVRIKASPKQLSKLRNGHKVKIAPSMSGEGINLIIDPAKYNHISRAFSKGKGSMVQLSPEEIRVNAETEMSGAGIFSTLKKGAKAVAKSSIGKELGKMAIDTAVKSASASGYVPPSVASAVGKEAKKQLAGAGVLDIVKKVAKSKIAKDLGKQAINMAVKKASASGYVPPSIAEAVGAEAKKKLAGAGILDVVKKVAKSKIAKDLGKQAIKAGVSYASKSGYVPPSVASALGNVATSALTGSGLTAGTGLYAGARGRGIMGRGTLMSVHNAGLPPALQSQNLSANFHFATQMPPSLQRVEMSGGGLYL